MNYANKRNQINFKLAPKTLTTNRLCTPAKTGERFYVWINEVMQGKLTRNDIANDQLKIGKRANG